ncbi:unnamed protein product, partial [Soboliphyme baturini]|uniref:GYF domain-containing protein n=1 Tax=Soboliphyme baturini TaxID=241478 RepID=A0A183IXU3_9BILA
MTETVRGNEQKEPEIAESSKKKEIYKYDQETMLKVSMLPASKVRPECLPEDFDVVFQGAEGTVVKLWSPDLWIQSLWDREDRTGPSASFRNGRARPAEADFRKRLGKRSVSPHKKEESTRNVPFPPHDVCVETGGLPLGNVRGRGRVQQRGGGGDNWREHPLNSRNKENKDTRFRSSNWSNNHRYDRRSNAGSTKELPEWATYNPTEQDETMELHGFEDDVNQEVPPDSKPPTAVVTKAADTMKGSMLDNILLSANLAADRSAGLLSKGPIDDMFAASAEKFNM